LLAIPMDSAAGLLASALHIGHYYGSYIAAASWLLAGSFQWLLLGYAIDLRCQKVPFSSRGANQFRVYAPLVIVLVLLGAAVGTAILNARSQRLGFRHPGISFGP
jgi:hypothetical protein